MRNKNRSSLAVSICMLSLLAVVFVGPVSALVEEGVTTNPVPPGYGFIDFEEGTDGEVVASTVPGVSFTTTMGYDWIYADIRTGSYNARSLTDPSVNFGDYVVNGYFCTWLGVMGDQGRIDFTLGTASYFSCLVSTGSGVTIDAYDSEDNFIAESGWASGNLGTYTFTRLTVEAPEMAYIIVHDTGNYWEIDDIVTDAPGVPREEIPVYVDIKPASWPNPLNLKEKGVLPVAVCGTEDFDVTTIDPETIQLTLEGVPEGVSPLRWSYEDVATPYEGEPCSGHDLDGDGYLDLTLKFKAQEVIQTLGLDAFSDGDVVILMLTGNIKAEFDGTPIQGQDCVRILKK
jgi:hypothetical protein